MSDVTRHNDSANYRAMRVPHENAAAGNAALKAFYDGVAELRKQHRIADVQVICSICVQYPEGEGEGMSLMHLGDELKAESMSAYALGIRQSQRRELIAHFVAGKSKP